MKITLTDPFLKPMPKIREIFRKLIAAGYSSATHHETTLSKLKLHGLVKNDLKILQDFAFLGQPVIDAVSVYESGQVDFILCVELEP
jgi:hypothetical protein